jgi:hypothetical protein
MSTTVYEYIQEEIDIQLQKIRNAFRYFLVSFFETQICRLLF